MSLLEKLKTHISLESADPGFHLSEEEITEIVLALQQRSEYLPRSIIAALSPKRNWKVQSFEYYAAHFLVGTGLIYGDLPTNIKSLAGAMQKQYDIGVEHGKESPGEVIAR